MQNVSFVSLDANKPIISDVKGAWLSLYHYAIKQLSQVHFMCNPKEIDAYNNLGMTYIITCNYILKAVLLRFFVIQIRHSTGGTAGKITQESSLYLR